MSGARVNTAECAPVWKQWSVALVRRGRHTLRGITDPRLRRGDLEVGGQALAQTPNRLVRDEAGAINVPPCLRSSAG